MTYEEARPWAKAMREEVLERRMPPWGAVEGVGSFRENPSLTALEIEYIVGWVEGGAPEGDAAYLPAKPEFPPATDAKVKLTGRHLAVESTAPATLHDPVTVVAITPRHLANGASMEVTAYKPDGSVEHLIWLRNYREEWTRTSWFHDPVHLPPGTSIVVDTTAPGAALISLQ